MKTLYALMPEEQKKIYADAFRIGRSRQTLFEDEHDEQVAKGYWPMIWLNTNWYAEMPIPYRKGRMRSRLLMVVGIPGTGKSVITRLLAWYVHRWIPFAFGLDYLYPVWIFDHGGRDHSKGYRPNQSPRNLPPGSSPASIEARYYFCPVYDEKGELRGRKKEPHEQLYIPNFSKYNVKQLVSMGFTHASAKNLVRIIRNFGPFKDLQSLHKFIEIIPDMRKDYKEVLLRDFENIVLTRNCWRMDDKYEIDIEELVWNKESAVFSYSDDKMVARADIDYLWKTLQQIIDKYSKDPRLIRPFLFFEEGQDIFADEQDGIGDSFEDAVKKLRKNGVPMAITLPTLQGVNPNIAAFARDWICGVVDGPTRELIHKYTGSKALFFKLETLRSDTTGDLVRNDMIYYSRDKRRAYLFDAFECPQEYNRTI
jgi:hypothetical protein